MTAKVINQGSKRKLVGVYIGWRGKSIGLAGLDNVSYWERKSVAEQVGKGGVTELLLRLEHAVIDPKAPNKNLYLVTGHSFGGAIVLTAMNEILLERVVSAEPKPKEECEHEDGANDSCTSCWRTRPFGHGVVLLNPAIEANEALQLKELVATRCFTRSQARLLHVISSDADQATHSAFRIGQFFGVNLRWRQTILKRTFGETRLPLRETELDTITVGNFLPFQTGRLQLNESKANSSEKWKYFSYRGKIDDKTPDAPRRIPVRHFEPLSFTDF